MEPLHEPQPEAGRHGGPPQAILFDLDGTLLDCHQIHFDVFQTTFRSLGIELSTTLYRRVYSPNWYRSYAALGLPPEVWKRIDRMWLTELRQRTVAPFPGAVALLADLASRFRLGLVTAGTGSRVAADLRRTGMADYFEVVVTGDDVQQAKPHPEGLQRALELLAVDTAQALFVGDSEVDFEMAASLGVSFVAVASPVSKFAPSARVRRLQHVTDLPHLLEIP